MMTVIINEVFFRIKVILSVVFLVFCIFILIFFFLKRIRRRREEKRQIEQLKRNLMGLYIYGYGLSDIINAIAATDIDFKAVDKKKPWQR